MGGFRRGSMRNSDGASAWRATLWPWPSDFPKRQLLPICRSSRPRAYLLAAPSTPDKACQAAIARERAGERITTRVAKEILGEAKNTAKRAPKAARGSGLALQPKKTLERYRDEWGTKNLGDLARHLRAFADSLDEAKQDSYPLAS